MVKIISEAPVVKRKRGRPKGSGKKIKRMGRKRKKEFLDGFMAGSPVFIKVIVLILIIIIIIYISMLIGREILLYMKYRTLKNTKSTMVNTYWDFRKTLSISYNPITVAKDIMALIKK